MTLRPTLFTYIAWQVFLGILTAFIIITGIIMLVDFVELSRTIGGIDNAGLSDVAFLTLLKAPQLIEETIPFVVLFGTMSALFKLNRRSELIILRAAGLSAWRFLLPGLLVAGSIGIFWSTVMNPVSARTEAYFNEYRNSLTRSIDTSTPIEDVKDVWLREGNDSGQTVIHAKSANIDTRTLSDVTFYQFTYDAQREPAFTTRYDAKSAQLNETGYWVLTSVIETADGRPKQPYESLSTPTSITWDGLREATGNQKSPPFWGLPAEIKKVESAGFSATPLIIKFNRLLALPLTLIAMAIIAAGASMQLTRLGGALRLIVLGAAIGFTVYFANNMISAFGETGALPPILAAWMVPVFVLFCGLARLCVIEDG